VVNELRWSVQIHGEKCSSSWEISVIREDAARHQTGYGWFDEKKLLVSHNGGPCRWPIIAFVWDAQVKLANELCAILNCGGDL
jgi:hypothetical protein